MLVPSRKSNVVKDRVSCKCTEAPGFSENGLGGVSFYQQGRVTYLLSRTLFAPSPAKYEQ